MIGPWNQLLESNDVATIAALAILEGLLSADNALILAMMVKYLPKEQQKNALLYGLGGAFIFRFIAILFATIVLKQWWLQSLGATYLLFVATKHFLGAASKKEFMPVRRTFWATVAVVEITDIAFAVDSVLAGITFVGNRESKIWVVFFGAIVGIVLLRFAASSFIQLLDKYPSLDHVAYALVGWVGIKLAFISANSWSKLSPLNPSISHVPSHVFWPVLLTVALVGGFFAMRHPDKSPPSRTDELEMIKTAQEFDQRKK